MKNFNDLRNFVSDLRSADQKDDTAFHMIISRSVELLQLLDKDIAREFGVSRPTVTRWRNGTNAPHPAMRKPVYNWLEKRASAILRRSEENLVSHSPTSTTAPATVAALGRERD